MNIAVSNKIESMLYVYLLLKYNIDWYRRYEKQRI